MQHTAVNSVRFNTVIPTTKMIENKVWIAAYGLIHPEWNDSVIAIDLKKNHGIEVRF